MDHLLVSQDRVAVGQVPLYGERAHDAWFVLGRAPESHVVLPALKVSKQHALIQRCYQVYWLCDLGSTNGTSLNGTRLAAHNPVQVYDGDVIEVGPFSLGCRLPGLLRPAPAGAAARAAQPAQGWSEAHARARTIAGDRDRPDPNAGAPSPYDNDVLSVSQGGVVVQNFGLKAERVSVGRMALCDLKLQDPAIPPEKAVIERRHGQYVLTNTAQDGPILINGRDAVPPLGQRPLQHRDWFYLGRYAVQCYFLSSLQQPAAQPSSAWGQGSDAAGGGFGGFGGGSGGGVDQTMRVDMGALDARLQQQHHHVGGGGRGAAQMAGRPAPARRDLSGRENPTVPVHAAAEDSDEGEILAEDDDDEVALPEVEPDRRWLWVGVAAAALVAAGVGVFVAIDGGRRRADPPPVGPPPKLAPAEPGADGAPDGAAGSSTRRRRSGGPARDAGGTSTDGAEGAPASSDPDPAGVPPPPPGDGLSPERPDQRP